MRRWCWPLTFRIHRRRCRRFWNDGVPGRGSSGQPGGLAGPATPPTGLRAGLLRDDAPRDRMRDMPATGADFFLVDRAVVDAFRQFGERHVSVLGLITWLGFSQDRIEYDKQPRLHGVSGWSLKKKVKLVLDSLTAFSSLPITVCWILGVCLVIRVPAGCGPRVCRASIRCPHAGSGGVGGKCYRSRGAGAADAGPGGRIRVAGARRDPTSAEIRHRSAGVRGGARGDGCRHSLTCASAPRCSVDAEPGRCHPQPRLKAVRRLMMVHKPLVRHVKRRTRAREFEDIERRALEVEHEIAKVATGNGPIIAGPWLAEVGYEVLYWLPFLRCSKTAIG